MSDDLMYRVAELERIVGSMIRMGKIEEVDYGKALCRVRSGGVLTGWLQWATTRAMGEKTWWAPRIGEQVMVFSPCGDLAQGKVMMAFYQDAATAPANSPDIHLHEYPDGAFFQYDEGAKKMSFYSPGDVDMRADGIMHLSARELELHADERREQDVAGHGEALNYVGGTTWKTDSYHDGAVFEPTEEHGIQPPEVK